ncbi:50S ribosomal protein L24 [Microbacterium sp. LMI1-1-1.1]|uniref:50S ribosomal protein L24 n=1 Tax=unclassified Microbacterium TaxID=2609290 RepID=UPI0034674D26
MAKIKKGDLVQVISGAPEKPKKEGRKAGDRGKQGKVLEILDGGQRVIVEGVNYVTKHNRVGQSQRGTKTGGIETFEAPIHISNVALVDPSTKKPTRVGHRVEEQVKDGVKRTVRVRFAKKSGKDL